MWVMERLREMALAAYDRTIGLELPGDAFMLLRGPRPCYLEVCSSSSARRIHPTTLQG